MIQSRHPFVVFALALLIVGVQYGAQLHALEHLGEELKRTPEQSFSTQPDTEICAICALFAGGANAVASDVGLSSPVFDSQEHSPYAPGLTARTTSRFYDSRAPPVFL